MREELRQLVIEQAIGGDDHGYRCRHGLVEIAFRERRPQLFLALGATHEYEPPRGTVRRGRRHPEKVIEFLQRLVGDRGGLPRVVGPCRKKQRFESVAVQNV